MDLAWPSERFVARSWYFWPSECRGRGRSKDGADAAQGRRGGADGAGEARGVRGAPESLRCVRGVSAETGAAERRRARNTSRVLQNAERDTGQIHLGPYKTAERSNNGVS